MHRVIGGEQDLTVTAAAAWARGVQHSSVFKAGVIN